MAFQFVIHEAPTQRFSLPSMILANAQAQKALEIEEQKRRQAEEDWRIQQAQKAAYSQTLDDTGRVADVRPFVQAVRGQNLGMGAMSALRSQELQEQGAVGQAAAHGLNAALLRLKRPQVLPDSGSAVSQAFQGAEAPDVGAMVGTSDIPQQVADSMIPGSPGYGAAIRRGQWAGQLPENPTAEQVRSFIKAEAARDVATIPVPRLGLIDPGKLAESLNQYIGKIPEYSASLAGVSKKRQSEEGYKEDLSTIGQIQSQALAANANQAAAREREIAQKATNAFVQSYNESGNRIIGENGKPIILDPQKFQNAAEAREVIETAFSKQKAEEIIDNLHPGMSPDQIAAWAHAASTNIGKLEGVSGTESQRGAFESLVLPQDIKTALYNANSNPEGLKTALIGYATRRTVSPADMEQTKNNLRASLGMLTTVSSRLKAYQLPEGETPVYRKAIGAAPVLPSAEKISKSVVARELKAAGAKKGPKPGSSAKTAILVNTPEEARALPAGTWFKNPAGKIMRTKGGK